MYRESGGYSRRGRGRGGSGGVGQRSRGRGTGAARSTGMRVQKFDEYYRGVYGSRWANLKRAMCMYAGKVALFNRYCTVPVEESTAGLVPVSPAILKLYVGAPNPTGENVDGNENVNEESGNTATADSGSKEKDATTTTSSIPHAARLNVIAPPPRDLNGIPAYYLLEYASTLVVEQLQVESFHKVLDLCASPGGKSIAIAQFFSPMGSQLTSNEQDPDRHARLQRNLQMHFPPTSSPVAFSYTAVRRDATAWHSPQAFDRVLVDAPCSSERHLLHQRLKQVCPRLLQDEFSSLDNGEGTPTAVQFDDDDNALIDSLDVNLSDWSNASSMELGALQRTILQRAFEACKNGGRVVYSTCSISPLENDDVVKGALQRTRCNMKVAEINWPIGEATAAGGWIVLPDVAQGWGPMYCCAFEKVSDVRPSGFSDDDDDAEDDSDDADGESA